MVRKGSLGLHHGVLTDPAPYLGPLNSRRPLSLRLPAPSPRLPRLPPPPPPPTCCANIPRIRRTILTVRAPLPTIPFFPFNSPSHVRCVCVCVNSTQLLRQTHLFSLFTSHFSSPKPHLVLTFISPRNPSSLLEPRSNFPLHRPSHRHFLNAVNLPTPAIFRL